ncbi:MAG: hypothetical protein LBT52_00040 [Clostridiales Family XIII bacterium]|jgi:hypothetical protein|nr:hypothetical protein [Clostridiales Family XIII bacterium]
MDKQKAAIGRDGCIDGETGSRNVMADVLIDKQEAAIGRDGKRVRE